MSWRRFLVLLAGLSPDSRWVCALRTDQATDRNTRRLDDPAAAEAYFAQIGG